MMQTLTQRLPRKDFKVDATRYLVAAALGLVAAGLGMVPPECVACSVVSGGQAEGMGLIEGDHLLDEALQLLDPGARAEARLECIWAWFESVTGAPLARPVSAADRERVADRLRLEHGTMPPPLLVTARRSLRLMASINMHEKAGHLVQNACRSCEIFEEDGKFPLARHFPVQVDPWSRQSTRKATKLKAAVRDSLAKSGSGWNEPWTRSPVCLTIVALMPSSSPRIDVDNLSKGLIDSLNGLLIGDDGQIQCLTARRVEYAGAVGMYLVSATAVRPWNCDVVFDDPTPPTVSWGARVERPR